MQKHLAFDFDYDFASLLRALARPQAFPFACPENEPIPIIQTHASAVLLTPELVYKLKKPKDFGFFDYSTPALRRYFCQQEVRLNAPLAPNIYLGIAPVLYAPDGQIRIGPTCSDKRIPEPGALMEGGNVVDYAIVMVRLPDEATLGSRVQMGTATPALLAEIARHVAKFHTTTATNDYISRFGSDTCIQKNWEENFTQMQPFIGNNTDRTIDARANEMIIGYIRWFIEERAALFASRINEQRIRDCHGDLRLQHIYILDQERERNRQLPRLALLDRIEFNQRFRYSDVASEIAFLVMELDAAGRSDLSRVLVDTYIAETGDEALRELLPFYCCYRAYVRGKVSSFQIDEAEVPAAQRQEASQAAKALFALATHYASGSPQPTMLLVGGLMGTGKSTLALALQHETGWKYFSSDEVRKQLAKVDPTQPQASDFDQGIYTAQWNERTYAALCEHAQNELAHGHSVIIDASFVRRTDRRAMARVAERYGARALFVECVCPQEVVLQRLAQRWKKRIERDTFGEDTVSDGRPELYNTQRSRWEPFDVHEEAPLQHITVATTPPLAHSLEQVLASLEVPRLACWLDPIGKAQ